MISKVVSRVYLDNLSFTFIKGELEAKTRFTKVVFLLQNPIWLMVFPHFNFRLY